MNGFENATAVVTGGGHNIGRAIATRLAAEGATVLILDVDTEAAAETVDTITEAGGDATAYDCDVTDVSAINEIFDRIHAEYGTIDILVNNVGGSTGVTLDDIDEPTFNENIDRNLKSAVFTTRAVLPKMREAGHGRVLYVSSINAVFGGFSEVAYAAAKNALHALVRSLTADYADEGLRFNVVCLGSIPGENANWDDRMEDGDQDAQSLADLYPVGRYGTPEDAANAAAFLLSTDADWITGEVLTVDGGLTATGNLPGGEWWTEL